MAVSVFGILDDRPCYGTFGVYPFKFHPPPDPPFRRSPFISWQPVVSVGTTHERVSVVKGSPSFIKVGGLSGKEKSFSVVLLPYQ